jgi:anti-sigma factor (TIGR02949 family)
MKRGDVAAPARRLSCEEAFRRLDDYLDRELSPQELRLVREHLHDCVRCASDFRFEEALVREIRARVRRLALPPDLLSRIMRRLEGVSGE